jgi:hypothetical protein
MNIKEIGFESGKWMELGEDSKTHTRAESSQSATRCQE